MVQMIVKYIIEYFQGILS